MIGAGVHLMCICLYACMYVYMFVSMYVSDPQKV